LTVNRVCFHSKTPTELSSYLNFHDVQSTVNDHMSLYHLSLELNLHCSRRYLIKGHYLSWMALWSAEISSNNDFINDLLRISRDFLYPLHAFFKSTRSLEREDHESEFNSSHLRCKLVMDPPLKNFYIGFFEVYVCLSITKRRSDWFISDNHH
jgi:hypothetical protein